MVPVGIIGGGAACQNYQSWGNMVLVEPFPDVRLPVCGVFGLMDRHHSVRKDQILASLGLWAYGDDPYGQTHDGHPSRGGSAQRRYKGSDRPAMLEASLDPERDKVRGANLALPRK